MSVEEICAVEVLDTGELSLGLCDEGQESYQFVYRAAAGVYWDPDRQTFKSTRVKKWSLEQWFSHIRSTVRDELGVELRLSDRVRWINVPVEQQEGMRRASAT